MMIEEEEAQILSAPRAICLDKPMPLMELNDKKKLSNERFDHFMVTIRNKLENALLLGAGVFRRLMDMKSGCPAFPPPKQLEV